MAASDGVSGRTVGLYQILHEIDAPPPSSAFVAEHRESQTLHKVVVYPLAALQSDPKLRLFVEREISIMRRIHSHPYILGLTEVFATEDELFVVLEFCEGGDLFEVVQSFNEDDQTPRSATDAPSGIPRKVVGRLFHELMLGVSYLHAVGFCHRDVKLENIQVDSNNQVKLSSFTMVAALATSTGVGAHHPLRVASNFSPSLSVSCGSIHYACPEIVDGKTYDGRCADVWSCGVVLFVLLTGSLPFGGKEDEVNPSEMPHVFDQIKRGDMHIMKHPAYLSLQEDDPARELLVQMLQPDPKKRITVKALLKHPFWRRYGVDTTTAASVAAAGLNTSDHQ